ncbi:unnamed protein product [Blepharisma stoltei]|uniref:Uncharacterized protein n=1 Tax=Blepharisma stoltei TaxID=1481888 RepID=A0AAU9JIK7_9CILI|nr:unnamed protein product [Blepharisma stoltei]
MSNIRGNMLFEPKGRITRLLEGKDLPASLVNTSEMPAKNPISRLASSLWNYLFPKAQINMLVRPLLFSEDLPKIKPLSSVMENAPTPRYTSIPESHPKTPPLSCLNRMKNLESEASTVERRKRKCPESRFSDGVKKVKVDCAETGVQTELRRPIESLAYKAQKNAPAVKSMKPTWGRLSISSAELPSSKWNGLRTVKKEESGKELFEKNFEKIFNKNDFRTLSEVVKKTDSLETSMDTKGTDSEEEKKNSRPIFRKDIESLSVSSHSSDIKQGEKPSLSLMSEYSISISGSKPKHKESVSKKKTIEIAKVSGTEIKANTKSIKETEPNKQSRVGFEKLSSSTSEIKETDQEKNIFIFPEPTKKEKAQFPIFGNNSNSQEGFGNLVKKEENKTQPFNLFSNVQNAQVDLNTNTIKKEESSAIQNENKEKEIEKISKAESSIFNKTLPATLTNQNPFVQLEKKDNDNQTVNSNTKDSSSLFQSQNPFTPQNTKVDTKSLFPTPFSTPSISSTSEPTKVQDTEKSQQVVNPFLNLNSVNSVKLPYVFGAKQPTPPPMTFSPTSNPFAPFQSPQPEMTQDIDMKDGTPQSSPKLAPQSQPIFTQNSFSLFQCATPVPLSVPSTPSLLFSPQSSAFMQGNTSFSSPVPMFAQSQPATPSPSTPGSFTLGVVSKKGKR